jgi:hypothetical protein
MKEGSLIWEYILNERTFGVISAYVFNLTDEKNKERHELLRKDIRKTGLGYIEQKSGYSYLSDNGNGIPVEEYSFFIPEISYDKLLELGKKYNQESVIYKNSERFDLIEGSTEKVIISFSKESMTFKPENLKNAWSSFLKSKNKNALKLYTFYLKEFVVPTKSEMIMNQKNKELLRVKIIDLF